MAAGIPNLTNLATTVAELYEKPFFSMRDSEKGFLTRVKTKRWPKNTFTWKVRDAEYSKIWTIAESQMTDLITTTILATDGVGSAVQFLAPNNHPLLNAAVTMRYAYGAIEIPGTLVDGMTGGGNAGGAWLDAVKDETDQAVKDLWRDLNTQMLDLSTTVDNSGLNFDGLGHIFNTAASHTYAGIATATFTEWTTAADTTTVTLTIGAMQTMRNKLEGNTESISPNATRRASTIKEWWASPEQFTAYGNLLTGLRRYNASETLDGGFAMLEFYGRKVVEIPNFPANLLIPYSERDGGLFHVILNNFKAEPKDQNIADGKLIVISHKGNLALTNRTKQGVFNVLV
jgi:hypothetical protein